MTAQIDISNADTTNELVQQYLEQIRSNQQPDVFELDENQIPITSEDFKSLIQAGVKINKVKIYIEKPLSFLDEIVPENLVNSVPEKYQGYAKNTDEEGNVTCKTYRECCRYRTNDTYCLVEFGFVDSNKNRDIEPVFEEIMAWIQHFPEDTLWGGKLLKDKYNPLL